MTGAQPVVPTSRRLHVDRVVVLTMVGITLGIILVARLWYLQIATGEDARQRADTNRLRVETSKPLRGIVYDRGGQVLARNVSSFTASVRVTDLPRDRVAQDAVFARLGAIIGMSPQAVRSAAEPGRADPFTPVRVKSPLTRDQALILEEQHTSLPGVVVRFTPVRAYPESILLGQVMGYVGPIPPTLTESRIADGYARDDVIGLAGVEASFEAELRGASGRQQVEVDAMGRVTNVLETLAPVVPGANLVLTIDLPLQRVAATALARGMARTKSPQGALVAIDTSNGEVLALVGLPGYDDNRFATGISQEDYSRLADDQWRPMFPHAIGGQFPPGSTFKMVTAAAALQEKVVSPSANVNCTGSITRNGLVFRDWTPQGHGPVNARQALGVSCDVYFYSVAGGNPFVGLQGLGMARLATYARAFGFGEKLGIRLPGEAPGLVPSAEWKRQAKNEPWYVGDEYNAGIGQGDVLATPLQLASMTAAIANGGTLYRPRIARELRDSAGTTLKAYPPEVIRAVPVAPEYLAAIRAGMHDTTNSSLIVPGFAGTAYGALRPYALDMAGKTGTAEFEGPRDAKGNLPTHALFVGYAPYQDPRIAVAIFLFGGGEGSEIAAPIAGEVIRAYLFGAGSTASE
jgi:penicillin-binding protein 2